MVMFPRIMKIEKGDTRLFATILVEDIIDKELILLDEG
jgi:hypothetical protein